MNVEILETIPGLETFQQCLKQGARMVYFYKIYTCSSHNFFFFLRY